MFNIYTKTMKLYLFVLTHLLILPCTAQDDRNIELYDPAIYAYETCFSIAEALKTPDEMYPPVQVHISI